MKKYLLSLLILSSLYLLPSHALAATKPTFWQVQSIDTMKYSRDVARQYLNDPKYDDTIDAQVKVISETGATHVAIATPYDAEFVPFLDRWVKAVRKYHLNVWFRGNLAGWENWFNYPDLTPSEHTAEILEFIKNNPNIFADDDIFTSCPECENGGVGDPRQTGKVKEYRQFLISEHDAVRKVFDSLGKQITTNYYSMNADVARLVMDKDTTTSLGGIVTIDHYVATPEKLAFDIQNIAESSGGLIVLGEWGAPIPDIHGKMDEKAQADWISKSLELLVKSPFLIGLNYWTNQGSSTALWNSPQKPKEAVIALKSYYHPKAVDLTIKNTAGRPLFANINYLSRGYSTDKNGKVSLPWPGYSSEFSLQVTGYKTQTLTLTPDNKSLLLDPEQKNWWYQVHLLTYRLSQFIIHLIK